MNLSNFSVQFNLHFFYNHYKALVGIVESWKEVAAFQDSII